MDILTSDGHVDPLCCRPAGVENNLDDHEWDDDDEQNLDNLDDIIGSLDAYEYEQLEEEKGSA